MLQKTQGISLYFLKYKESSIIAKIYTEQFGLQSYLINGVRKEKAIFKVSLFQPLTILEMVVYHKENKDSLQRISEVRCAEPYQNIPYDMFKTNTAFFMAEVLSKTLQGERENTQIFSFLLNYLRGLDTEDFHSNFPIYFLLNLIEKLGLLGDNCEVILQTLHDLHILKQKPSSMQKEIAILNELKSSMYGSFHLPTAQRRQLLDMVLAYYRIHFEGLGELKSLQVLRSLV
ncbi:MAG: DNA repair protein RecO [Thermonemataceae bacterium]|nr:DNA repair protein RecO [Thermonemataceae bacterium]